MASTDTTFQINKKFIAKSDYEIRFFKMVRRGAQKDKLRAFDDLFNEGTKKRKVFAQ